jgi:hypothetical protein
VNGKISEEEARELWRRAAELQAADQQRSELASAAGTSVTSASGLSLEQIAVAAEGAGIAPDYVRVALAEQQLPDADRIDRNLWSARWLRAILREPETIEDARTIAAAPANVLAALRTIVGQPAYGLILESTIGTDPLRDAVLVYRIGASGSSFQSALDFADARVFLFTIRPDAGGTRITLRAPLYRRGINLAMTGVSAGLLGWGGSAAGAAVSGMLPAIGGAALVAAPITIGVLAGIAGGVGLYRRMYRMVYRRGTAAVKQLLQAVAAEAVVPGNESS